MLLIKNIYCLFLKPKLGNVDLAAFVRKFTPVEKKSSGVATGLDTASLINTMPKYSRNICK